MSEGSVRITVAAIILLGQGLVFVGGLLLGVIGPLEGSNLWQVVLMGSPVLATSAPLAIKFISDGHREIARGETVTSIFAVFVIAVPTLLIAIILGFYWLTFKQFPGFGPDQLKLGLGTTETTFGLYLSGVADKLFSSHPTKPLS